VPRVQKSIVSGVVPGGIGLEYQHFVFSARVVSGTVGTIDASFGARAGGWETGAHAKFASGDCTAFR